MNLSVLSLTLGARGSGEAWFTFCGVYVSRNDKSSARHAGNASLLRRRARNSSGNLNTVSLPHPPRTPTTNLDANSRNFTGGYHATISVPGCVGRPVGP